MASSMRMRNKEINQVQELLKEECLLLLRAHLLKEIIKRELSAVGKNCNTYFK